MFAARGFQLLKAVPGLALRALLELLVLVELVLAGNVQLILRVSLAGRVKTLIVNPIAASPRAVPIFVQALLVPSGIDNITKQTLPWAHVH